jgi:hypothetical protein
LVPDCTLPFANIAKHHPIDDNCPARGEVPDPPVEPNDPAHALQNVAKNNFCATGSPVLVTFLSFKKLQEQLEQTVPEAKTWGRKPNGQEDLPADRSVLLGLYTTSEGVTIGEGTLVTFAFAQRKKIRQDGPIQSKSATLSSELIFHRNRRTPANLSTRSFKLSKRHSIQS